MGSPASPLPFPASKGGGMYYVLYIKTSPASACGEKFFWISFPFQKSSGRRDIDSEIKYFFQVSESKKVDIISSRRLIYKKLYTFSTGFSTRLYPLCCIKVSTFPPIFHSPVNGALYAADRAN